MVGGSGSKKVSDRSFGGGEDREVGEMEMVSIAAVYKAKCIDISRRNLNAR